MWRVGKGVDETGGRDRTGPSRLPPRSGTTLRPILGAGLGQTGGRGWGKCVRPPRNPPRTTTPNGESDTGFMTRLSR